MGFEFHVSLLPKFITYLKVIFSVASEAFIGFEILLSLFLARNSRSRQGSGQPSILAFPAMVEILLRLFFKKRENEKNRKMK